MLKPLRKLFAKLSTEAIERAEVKEFEEANAVTPQQGRWLAFGAPLAYKEKESAHIFKLLPDSYGQEKDAHPLLMRIAELWEVEDTKQAKAFLDSALALEGSTKANEIYARFLSQHEKRYDATYGKDLCEHFFVKRSDTEDAKGLTATLQAAEKISTRAVDWHLIQNDITDEAEIEEVHHDFAHNLLPQIVTGGVKSYSDVLDKLTRPLFESHQHPAETYEISNFAAYDLGRVAYASRVFAAVDLLSEEEAWEYIRQAADTAAKMYRNWHEYVAAYLLGNALVNAGINYGDEASRINSYLIAHANSPLKKHSFA